MSKLVEALKRAEQLRKQKLVQEKLLQTAAHESAPISPEKQIEVALLAQEARMAAQRVHTLYEAERGKKNEAITAGAAAEAAADASLAQQQADEQLAREVLAREAAESAAETSATTKRNADLHAAKTANQRRDAELAARAASEKRTNADLQAAVAAQVRAAAEAAATAAARARTEMELAAKAAAETKLAAELEAAKAAAERTVATSVADEATSIRAAAEHALAEAESARATLANQRSNQVQIAETARKQAEALLASVANERGTAETELRLLAQARLAEETELTAVVTKRIEVERQAAEQTKRKLVAEQLKAENQRKRLVAEKLAVAAAEQRTLAEAQATESSEANAQADAARVLALEHARNEVLARTNSLRDATAIAAHQAASVRARSEDTLAKLIAERASIEARLLALASDAEETGHQEIGELAKQIAFETASNSALLADIGRETGGRTARFSREREQLKAQLTAEAVRREALIESQRLQARDEERIGREGLAALADQLAEEAALTHAALECFASESRQRAAQLETKQLAQRDAALAITNEQSGLEQVLRERRAELESAESSLAAEEQRVLKQRDFDLGRRAEAESNLVAELAAVQLAQELTAEAAALRIAAEQRLLDETLTRATAGSLLVTKEREQANAEAALAAAADMKLVAERELTAATAAKISAIEAATRRTAIALEKAALAEQQARALAAIENAARLETEKQPLQSRTSQFNPLINMKLPTSQDSLAGRRWRIFAGATAVMLLAGVFMGVFFEMPSLPRASVVAAAAVATHGVPSKSLGAPDIADLPVVLKLDPQLGRRPPMNPK